MVWLEVDRRIDCPLMLELMRTPGPVRRLLLVSLQSSVGNAVDTSRCCCWPTTASARRGRSARAARRLAAGDRAGAGVGALADRYSRRPLAVSADLLRAASFVGLLIAVPGAVALRDTRLAAATAGYERRGRQTGRQARGAGCPAGY